MNADFDNFLLTDVNRVVLKMQYDDEGIAEALQRDAEMEANPEMTISLQTLGEHVARRQNAV